MAKTYYRTLNEDITDEENNVINKKGERLLTSEIDEEDFEEPKVCIFSKHWYYVPINVFKKGIVERFT